MKTLSPIVVIGGGHAGLEAAHAAARGGADVALVTLKAEALGRLSCNPAIGGIGKSHLVREIDAMGGLMARCADRAGIHFRVLNRSRGPAVQGPRVQQDLATYPEAIATEVSRTPGIEVVEGEAASLEIEGRKVRAVVLTDGRRIAASAVVLTTGTFLRGAMFRGADRTEGGRTGEPAANELSRDLRALGLELGRFKTGTPPRLTVDSVDFSRFEKQPGDARPEPLAFENLLDPGYVPNLAQTDTHLAYTSPSVHALVRENLGQSPLFSGRMSALGPRYCPSFEDKVVKFGDRDRHLLHLEPMGLEHPWIYVNGLSTSLPDAVQEEIVRAIPGLENAEIARFGYAVEYDYAPPQQLWPTLETRGVEGLFLAGQICGTTGYEEAAGLGLVAGANALMVATGRDAWIPSRLESYLGVMVDDLTTRGVLEPYRMFTSRAELRLTLSPDSADARLTPQAAALGLVSNERTRGSTERWNRLTGALEALERPGCLRASSPKRPADAVRRGEDAEAILSTHLPDASRWSDADRRAVIARMRYRGYLERELREAEKLRKADAVKIPTGFAFDAVPGLSHEVRQRLVEVAPSSVGQAGRIPGVTPAALALLTAAIVGNRRERAKS